jgi:FkbM family methyltransferase
MSNAIKWLETNGSLTNFIKLFARVYFENRNVRILEAGADNGSDTENFCQMFPNSTIYAFEPDPRRHERLSSIASKYSNLHYENCALGVEEGDIDFYVSTRVDEYDRKEVWGSSSALKPKEHLRIHPQIKFEAQPIKVKSVNLDLWMKKNFIPSLNMMWLDMQGYEYNVLNSSPLSTLDCDFIYSEVHLIETYEDNKCYNSLKQLLDIRGFIPLIEELPWVDSGNVLFFKKELIEKAVSKLNSAASLF